MGVRVIESEETAAVADAVERAIEQGGALIVVAFDRAARGRCPPSRLACPWWASSRRRSATRATGKPWVWIDDRRAAAEATAYLLGLGHRTVHYVSIPSLHRVQPAPGGLAVRAGSRRGSRCRSPVLAGWHPRSGYEAGQLLAADPEVTAVLCGNDDLALGVIRAMREAGRPVPGSVSVVGFDDIPQAEFFTPALTTVRLDFTELGRASFAALQEQIGATRRQGRGRGPS